MTIFQSISGFSAIIKEETNVKTKDLMLEYLSDIMDNAQDFGWLQHKALMRFYYAERRRISLMGTN